MTRINEGYWHRYDMGEHGGIIVDYQCPFCKNWFHITDVRRIAVNGVVAGGSLRCSCGFHDYLQLVGWIG